MSEKKERQVNMESLRIVAMLMIIMLHLLDKGGILGDFALKTPISQNLFWIIEAMCMISVNLYVLISGYFLYESQFKVKKLVLLWLQVIAYSWIITAIVAILGGGLTLENGIYDLIPLILPVTGGHYWFATVYILLYVCSPFLNKALKAMDKKQHKIAIVVAVIIFSAWNTFLPMTIPLTDHDGMDLGWFVVLYIIAAYIRKYEKDIKFRKELGMFIYVVCFLLMFGLGKGLLMVDMVVGKLGGFAQNFYPYNSLLNLIGSVAFFLMYVKTEFKGPKFMGKITLWLSAGTFGVYLLHEHRLLRYEWPKLLYLFGNNDSLVSMVYKIIALLIVVFMTGAIVDSVRRLIVNLVLKIGEKKND